MHKELATAQIFQYQIEFAASLEGIDQLNDEWMLKIESKRMFAWAIDKKQ